MDAIHIDVAGARQVGIRFDEFPDALYADLQREISGLGAQLLAGVEAATPTRSGMLHSQERLRIFSDPTRITAYVDIAGRKGSQDFAKAAALEYGARRSTKVSAHQMALDHYWAERLAAPVSVMVEAYSRTPNVAEYAFERGPLKAMEPEVLARLNTVVEKATAEANR